MMAQFTIVSGTVRDVNGIPYSGGSITAQIVLSPGGGTPTLNGNNFTAFMSPIALDSTGSFIARLADNNVILPSGTKWNFIANDYSAPPLGTGPQICSATLTITGASQSISSSFSACPALSNAGSGSGAPTLFAGVPTGPCTANQTAVNTLTGDFYTCVAGAWTKVAPSVLVSPVTAPNPLALDVNVAFKGPNPYIDATRFGVRAVVPSAVPAVPGITATCTSGSPNVTLSSASTFQNLDGVALYGCGPGTIGVPSAPTVTPSVLAAQTGLLLDVPGPVGVTTYCYQLVARTYMGATNVSTETCTNTGPTSLGLQTNTITTITLSNTTATYTTSAAHGLVAGAHIVVTGAATTQANGGAGGQANLIPFNGWFKVATVPDTTHFTVNLLSDTRNGAITAGTGGTVSYWNSIHLKATETTNNYQYYVYGRVSGGTKTLIGTMWPQDTSLVNRLTDVTYLVFDDLGSPVTTFPNPPPYIPTTVPTVATNDMLATTIVSGGGTTSLVLFNNAGNTISGATIIFDDAVTFLAGATYATNVAGGTNGPLMLPEPGNTQLSYVFNSPISIGTGATSRLTVLQKGLITLNEPISTTVVDWWGQPTSNNSYQAFSNMIGVPINVNKASPGFFIKSSTFFHNLTVAMLSTGGSTSMIQESGGIPGSGAFRDVGFGTGPGGTTYSNMPLVFRGDGAGYDFTNTTLSGSQNGNLIADTPGMYFDGIGNAVFKNLSLSGIGIATRVNSAGGFILTDNVYCQGCYEPYFSVVADAADPVATFVMSLKNVTFDTHSLPVVANYGGHAVTVDLVNENTASSNDPNITGSFPPGSSPKMNLRLGGSLGTPINTSTSTLNASYNVNDGTFGRVAMGVDLINKNVSIGPGYSFFSTTGAYPSPTCPVSAGGAVPIGVNSYFYAPLFASGSEGSLSTVCNATTTNGNQTVTLNWAAVPGVTQYNVYRGIGGVVLLNCSPITGTTLVDTSAGVCGQSTPNVAAGGPAGIHGGLVWAQTVQVGDRATITSGAGAPSAGLCTTVTGGKLYLRTDGTTTTTLYLCDGATGTWTAK